MAQTQPPAPDSPEAMAAHRTYQNQLNDWPNFKRYREKNAEVAPPAPKTKIALCFMATRLRTAGN
ncbi:MAG: hypothetical protein U0Y68_06025 [Blastocatellia bacterium]